MFLSHIFAKTTKESSTDASSANADLLERGGFIHKTMAGVYSYLPLGTRVLSNIENILREEMDKIGSEVFLPSLAPVENWKKTGRYDNVNVLLKASPANPFSAKHNDAEYALGSTHEEIITPLVQRYCTSYQDLPCAAYQIQTKFRNEPRPKSGILRGREFRMKDLYSFHASEEDMLDYFYNTSIPAYTSFFKRIGLGDITEVVLASGGDFSKEYSREFQTRCETGEDHIFHAPGSDTFYNREIAPSKAKPWDNAAEEERPREDIVGEGIIGVEDLAAFLKIEVERTTKTLLFETDTGQMVAAVVRGEYDVNEEKLRTVVGCKSLHLAPAASVKKVTGAEVGYAGPIGLPDSVLVIWDDSTAGRKNFECGANKTNEHSINVNFGTDIPAPSEFHDIKVAREGDLDPETGKPYEVFRACEVGNVFTLYTKFSDAFGFTVTGADGKQQPVYMGCYGIGTTRVMGVLAEVFHDEHGLLWPANIAPARVHIVPIAKTSEDKPYKEALKLYESLSKKGVTCLFDDRLNATVGSRLADADLIGVPTRMVLSAKTLDDKGVEVKDRKTGDVQMLSLKDAEKSVSA
ncbi:proline--tRNA ligase [Candidatus Peregrinibacteria bacterium CG10_big_fil_rev_8_21_14_0_10_49_24]|nr:MAG: proline--tRNA ligase [Candidatus Peregrinibacteria bacterium CG11_big_fil_rev_8_21_14_0_20_49_14]PIR50552.1 MAG: proline--tRNA ligase [Candidatus Peregrinibacteria bacterium CG10_big_fil_rev_8_21_14_0_10_49_24]PJA67921.1 MAG: proline--tRNA ligase [Candidatus Peregrinibacteria bacterium CG_4_9_14_3_um_filter_49_12]